jgi:tetratricopeptide (TPR) repeat protein
MNYITPEKNSPPGFNLGLILALLILAGLAACTGTPRVEEPKAAKPIEVPEPEVPEEGELLGTEAILTRIAQLLAHNDFDGALALFDTLDPEEEASPGIRLLNASVLSSAGRGKESRDIVNDIISREPDNQDALYVLAALEGAEGREREQRSILERIIKANPVHVGALTDLGAIALRSRSLKNAASYYDRVLAAEPRNGDALIGRARVYRYNREPQKAEALLNQAVTLYPEWALPLSERAQLYRGAGYPKQALEDLDRAKRLDADNFWISYDRGLALIDLNRKQDALEEFKRAISLEPDNFLAYVYTAGIQDDLGDYEAAEYNYGILAKLRPDYYFAFEGLGMHKMRKHLWAEARDAFLETYNQASNETSYALLTAVNWIRAGRQTDPRQFLTGALRKVQRDSMDWYLLRLFYDFTGDNDVALRIGREQNPAVKAKALFYLAQFYDIRGNKNLADKYFLEVYELNQRSMPEWRLNNWIVTERNLKLDL